jgi:uncharacterized RmlC-like cupin family protein
VTPLAALAVNAVGVVLLALAAVVFRAAHRAHTHRHTGSVYMPSGRLQTTRPTHVTVQPGIYDWNEEP